MLLFVRRKGAPPANPDCTAEMKQLAVELTGQGILRRGALLAAASDAAWVRVRDGNALVTDRPFAGTKEVLGGFWVIEADSREEAIEVAQRCPHARFGPIEVHPLRFRNAYADTEKSRPFLLAFRMEEGLCDPDGGKMQQMIRFGEALQRDGTLVETAPLTDNPPPARIEMRNGKPFVTDGPFAETKEGVGGYSFVRVAGREAAIELAKRYPHATWGSVEVREIAHVEANAPPFPPRQAG